MKIYIEDFNLKNSITSGQFFRYEEIDDYFIILLNDRVVKISQDNNYLVVESNNMNNIEETIRGFFSLDIDYKKINNEILKLDNTVKDIIDSSIGYRIQKMEPFETLISYIISANNSVYNIRNCVNRLSNKFGQKVMFDNREYYLFPTIDEIKNITINELRDMKLGFRSAYVKEIIDKINNKEFDLEIINNMNTEVALDYLMNEKGIGLKVASCILLFSYSRYDVYPIDVWVKKIMNERFGLIKEKDIKEYMKTKYKGYSGLVIQYMFNFKRNIKEGVYL
jgi:N-glycosylase/DNA lyase